MLIHIIGDRPPIAPDFFAEVYGNRVNNDDLGDFGEAINMCFDDDGDLNEIITRIRNVCNDWEVRE